MSDIGDVQIQVNGQWVDLHEWLRTDATPEQVEAIVGKGKGSWIVLPDMRQAAHDLGRGIVDGIAGALRRNE